MKAIVFHQHGELDVLQYQDIDTPEPGRGEVRVAVEACSLNYHDVFTRQGMPGIKTPLPMIPGCDAAGRVDKAGEGVTGWSPGDRVLVDPVQWSDRTVMLDATNLGGITVKWVGTGRLPPQPGIRPSSGPGPVGPGFSPGMSPGSTEPLEAPRSSPCSPGMRPPPPCRSPGIIAPSWLRVSNVCSRPAPSSGSDSWAERASKASGASSGTEVRASLRTPASSSWIRSMRMALA
jgi:hypothetical protein